MSEHTDVDECSSNIHNCHAEATCSNTAGLFTCACNNGLTGDGVTCEGKRIVRKLKMVISYAMLILFTLSNVMLNISFNWILVLLFSEHTDTDECSSYTHNCDLYAATCSNTEGSFTCACNAGYTGDGVTCVGKWVNCNETNKLNMYISNAVALLKVKHFILYHNFNDLSHWIVFIIS